MNTNIDDIADKLRAGERFHITVSEQPSGDWAAHWTVAIYDLVYLVDLVDHGSEILYDVVSGDDLLDVMQRVAYYVDLLEALRDAHGPAHVGH